MKHNKTHTYVLIEFCLGEAMDTEAGEVFPLTIILYRKLITRSRTTLEKYFSENFSNHLHISNKTTFVIYHPEFTINIYSKFRY